MLPARLVEDFSHLLASGVTIMSASILLVALLFPLQAGKAQAANWAKFVPEDGRYAVEMPSTPNISSSKSRSGSGGSSRVVLKGCRTAAGGYFVQTLEYPSTMIAGSADSLLDAEREQLGRQYGGPPTGEKRITLEGSPGREFTIRGQPKGETGVVTTRVREYVVGKVLYALLVTSSPDKALPADADRFLGSLKVTAGAPAQAKAKGAASPAAGPLARRKTAAASKGAAAARERTLEGWGVALDPDGDCKIQPDGNSLVIEVPNTPHSLQGTLRSKANAPRVLREVDGDFEVQVKLEGAFTPSGDEDRIFGRSIGAGLVLFRDEENYITLERTAMMRKGQVMSSVTINEQSAGNGRGTRNGRVGEGTTYLRLVRKGSQILPSASNDGKAWQSLKPADVQWPERLKLGLTVVSDSMAPLSVTFSEYTVKDE